MTTYYYLAASLPFLMLDKPPPFTMDQFLAMCRRCMRPSDLAVLHALLEEPTAAEGSQHCLVGEWVRMETQLRNAVARIRGTRLRVDAGRYLKPVPAEPRAERAVVDAYARPSPLEREIMLDRFRWEQAGRFAGRRPFTLRSILAYALRLRILLRWTRLEDKAGATRLEKILSAPPQPVDNHGTR